VLKINAGSALKFIFYLTSPNRVHPLSSKQVQKKKKKRLKTEMKAKEF